MIKQTNRFFVIVILLAWLSDFLFWGQSLGANLVIFLTLCVLGGGYLLLAEQLKPARKSLWLLFPFLFFGVVTFIRQEPLTLFLAYAFIFLSLGVLTNTYLGGFWPQYRLFDYFRKTFSLFGSMLVRPKNFLKQTYAETSQETRTKTKQFILPALRGLLIALPIVAIFGSLLASADLIFARKLTDFFDNFSFVQVGETALRLILILIYGYILIGIFLHAAFQSKDNELLEPKPPSDKSVLGFIEASIVLGSVVALFLAFVIVQFQYFFGGEANIGSSGFTYSQYARRGFNELVTVAFFSLILILSLSNIVQRATISQRRIYSGLSAVIVALVLVILVSAYQRLDLAILWHGFSRLRLYPRIFLIWLGMLLVVVVILEARQLTRYFAFAVALASLGFAVSLAFTNVDAAIVRYNVLRASLGWHFNATHLASLSADAVPALVDEFLYSSLPTDTREGVGAVLACYLYPNSARPTEDWRSFNLSRWRANQALDKVQGYLDDYQINYKQWPIVRVRTPSKTLFACQGEY